MLALDDYFFVRVSMLKAALVLGVAGILAVAASGCSSACSNAEDACNACSSNTADFCSQQIDTCKILIGPSQSSCCDSVYDTYKHCE